MHVHTSSSHHTPPVDPRELDRARRGWARFTKYTAYFVLHMIALLILMAIFLL